MGAGQLYMDVTAHNVANANTGGFRASRTSFRDRIGPRLHRPVLTPEDQLPVSSGGVAPAAISRSDGQGPLIPSGSPYHLAIQGPGFFRLRAADGTIIYTRDGSFALDAEGRLATPEGALLLDDDGSPLELPRNTLEFSVSQRGEVLVETPSGSRRIGTISLAMFINPSGLQSRGRNEFTATLASGPAQMETPGSGGSGTIIQGMLEQSNVNLGTEMVNMLLAHRYTQFNARVIQTSDEMMAMANRLPS